MIGFNSGSSLNVNAMFLLCQQNLMPVAFALKFIAIRLFRGKLTALPRLFDTLPKFAKFSSKTHSIISYDLRLMIYLLQSTRTVTVVPCLLQKKAMVNT